MLDLPKDTFAKHFREEVKPGHQGDGDLGAIRLLQYPGKQTETTGHLINTGKDMQNLTKKSYGISPHTDFELFTLLHQDASGLQVVARPDIENNKGGELHWTNSPVVEEF